MDLRFLIAKGLKRILQPPALRACSIDQNAKVCAKSELNYVHLGQYSYIGNDCFMVNADIGKFCSIADRVCIGGAGHPIERVSSSPVFHEGNNILGIHFQSFPYNETKKTIIENDVWIGFGTIIKAGVIIHNGAVVGAGSVVTHDIPPYEIWAGTPARHIRDRFSNEIRSRLEESAWWNWSDDRLRKYSAYFEEPRKFLEIIAEEENRKKQRV